MKENDENTDGKVVPFPGENGASGENQPTDVPPAPEAPPTDGSTAEPVQTGAEAPELAEFCIALSLMPNGRVMFMKPDIPVMREASDDDILSLLERGQRQLERMITISTIRGAINEGMQNAANIGAMSAVQFMSEKAKGGNILIPR